MPFPSILVYTILGLLATACGIRIGAALPEARREVAQAELATLADAVELFRLDVGRLPRALEELASPPAGHEPLLSVGDLLDPWGNPYLLRVGREGAFRVVCLGSDGAEGGRLDAADLTVP